ncbi:hypothetical protein GP486_007540, partial [Trichoglossum hirsutum]
MPHVPPRALARGEEEHDDSEYKTVLRAERERDVKLSASPVPDRGVFGEPTIEPAQTVFQHDRDYQSSLSDASEGSSGSHSCLEDDDVSGPISPTSTAATAEEAEAEAAAAAGVAAVDMASMERDTTAVSGGNDDFDGLEECEPFDSGDFLPAENDDDDYYFDDVDDYYGGDILDDAADNDPKSKRAGIAAGSSSSGLSFLAAAGGFHGDIAVVISYAFVGKPKMVDIAPSPRSSNDERRWG